MATNSEGTTVFIESEVKEEPYRIVTGRDPVDLELKINALLRDGWEPVGSPFAFGKYVLQAMVIVKGRKIRYGI